MRIGRLDEVFRRYLVAGLLTLLPLVVTVWVVRGVFNTLVGIFQEPLTWASAALHLAPPPRWALALLSACVTLIVLVVVGALVGNFVGRQILSWLDELMLHVPLVKGIYGATKQLIGAIQSGQGGSFKEVVLVEWPHPGSWTLGFVARRDCSWAVADGQHLVAVYVPTAPNPTSGYVVMVPEGSIRPVDVSPDQALTWAVSGGVIAPLPANGAAFKAAE